MSSVTFLVSAIATVCLFNAIDERLVTEPIEKKVLINQPAKEAAKPATVSLQLFKPNNIIKQSPVDQVGFVNTFNELSNNTQSKVSKKQSDKVHAI